MVEHNPQNQLEQLMLISREFSNLHRAGNLKLTIHMKEEKKPAIVEKLEGLFGLLRNSLFREDRQGIDFLNQELNRDRKNIYLYDEGGVSMNSLHGPPPGCNW